VGFVWFQIIPKENSAFGWDIYLEQEFRSKGIGRHVMQKCGEELLQRGISFAKICVFEHNEIARRLYESLGFTIEKFDEQRRQFTLILKLSRIID
jgi:ribosomal protein S18 acetylase RimI-like enzyme